MRVCTYHQQKSLIKRNLETSDELAQSKYVTENYKYHHTRVSIMTQTSNQSPSVPQKLILGI